MARERGLKSTDCTGELLDSAAEYLDVRRPGLDTKTLQRWLDPEAFIRNHNQLGGTAPEENGRLLDKRKTLLEDAISRQKQRQEAVGEGLRALNAAADEILNSQK
jgi:hypothetical protein